MKKYSDYPFASISMSKDVKFTSAIKKLFAGNAITHVFESGTYNGLGSTTMLAETALATGTKIEKFVTLEVDTVFYKQAKKNLSKYPFITVVNGLSVRADEALKFVSQDDAILNHEKYPELFIDDLVNPVAFYTNEINGHLSKTTGTLEKFTSIFSSGKSEFVEGAFDKLLPEFRGKNPLVLLDSAGGIGYFEFQKVKQILAGTNYFLILDDIHHLKHFRSHRDIQNDPEFTILDIHLEHGWLLAVHKSK